MRHSLIAQHYILARWKYACISNPDELVCTVLVLSSSTGQTFGIRAYGNNTYKSDRVAVFRVRISTAGTPAFSPRSRVIPISSFHAVTFMMNDLRAIPSSPLHCQQGPTEDHDELAPPLRRVTTRGTDGRLVDITPQRPRKPSLSDRLCKNIKDSIRKRLRSLKRKRSLSPTHSREFVPRIHSSAQKPDAVQPTIRAVNASAISFQCHDTISPQSRRSSRFAEVGLRV